MRFFLFSFVFFILICDISFCIAQETLNIHQKDGVVVSYVFAEEPIVTYTNEGIHVTTVKEDLDCPFANIRKFTFSDSDESSIGIPATKDTNDETKIYDLRGLLVETVKQRDGRVTLIKLCLPNGIYVVKNGGATFKITIRSH